MTIQIPPEVSMEFNIQENENFEAWVLRVQSRLRDLAAIVGRKSRTEAERGRQEDLIAHLDLLLENLSDIKLEVMEHMIRAKEYYQDWLADETQMRIDNELKPPARKTVQDYCAKVNCSQRRILDRIEAMNGTIEFRVSICQSVIKSMKP
jgi:hypothetical protein